MQNHITFFINMLSEPLRKPLITFWLIVFITKLHKGHDSSR